MAIKLYRIKETPQTEAVRKALLATLCKDDYHGDSFDFSKKSLYEGTQTNFGKTLEMKMVEKLAKLMEPTP